MFFGFSLLVSLDGLKKPRFFDRIKFPFLKLKFAFLKFKFPFFKF